MEHLDELQDLAEPEDLQFARKVIQKEFTKQLFDIIKEIQAKKIEADSNFQVYRDDEYENEDEQ